MGWLEIHRDKRSNTLQKTLTCAYPSKSWTQCFSPLTSISCWCKLWCQPHSWFLSSSEAFLVLNDVLKLHWDLSRLVFFLFILPSTWEAISASHCSSILRNTYLSQIICWNDSQNPATLDLHLWWRTMWRVQMKSQVKSYIGQGPEESQM